MARVAVIAGTVAAAGALLMNPARAETTAIKGYVSDLYSETKVPLAGVLVRLRSRSQSMDAHTDKRGFYSLVGVTPEKQVELTFSRDGMATKTFRVSSCVDTTLEVDAMLASHIGAGTLGYFYISPTPAMIRYEHSATLYSVDPEADLGNQGSESC
ncbi:MAG TPA: carboxypeptidase regulatory-like domain-containing protein [Candidatus Eremiobacteraceae bacterium]|nr:carboxypeptidase regulatory-like domain-containing protein [Candidatus Eremiobacteraceae bacterium]